MEDLATVCRTLLDNASMDVEFQDSPFSVCLTFYVVGTDQKVVFDCAEIALFQLTKDPMDRPNYVVLETKVTEPRTPWHTPMSEFGFRILPPEVQEGYYWRIDVNGGELCIKCLAFAWQQMPMSADELTALNPPGWQANAVAGG